MAAGTDPARSTRWPAVLLVTSAGIVAAMQVGKGAIAAPLLQFDLGIGLADIGWMAGIFALIGLFGGIPTGAMIAGYGARRMLILGLAVTATGAATGALAPGFSLLLVSRIVEGAGFVIITIAAPAMLGQLTRAADQDSAFALWSCFMPAGMALAMLAGPLFDGWRAIWWAGMIATLPVMLAVALVLPASGSRQPWSWRGIRTDTIRVMRAEGPVVMAGIFALYSLMFFALFSFLPVLLMERMALTHGAAGLLSALATTAGIAGNLAAGYLLSRRVTRGVIVAGASLVMGATSFGIFLPLFGDGAAFALCLIFAAVGGLIPATLLASAPLAAPAAGLVPVVLGLIVQGNNLGQILGPVAIGRAIEGYGWGAAAILVAAAALLAALMAARLRRI